MLNLPRKKRKNCPTNYRLSNGGHRYELHNDNSNNVCTPSKRLKTAGPSRLMTELTDIETSEGLTAECCGKKIGSIIKSVVTDRNELEQVMSSILAEVGWEPANVNHGDKSQQTVLQDESMHLNGNITRQT